MSQCKSLTKNGTQCTRNALPRGRYCWQHDTPFLISSFTAIGILLALVSLWADLFSLGFLERFAESPKTSNSIIAPGEVVESTVTVTPSPTDTLIPIATETLTVTPSPSPTPDIRVIDIDPRKILLQKDQLPANGRYYIPNEGWMSPHTNSEIVSAWTVEEGRSYLAETGRIHGWIVIYKRGTSSAVMPEEIFNNVALYSTTEGAHLVVSKYGSRELLENGYNEIEVPQIGDVSRAFQKTVRATTWLRLIFSYRNVLHGIELWGSEQDVSMDFAVDVANRLLADLKQLPLSDTVQFTP